MRVDLGNGQPKESWHKVYVEGDEGFDVLVRHPTYEQKTRDIGLRYDSSDDAPINRARHRIETAIAGWRGLVQESEVCSPDDPRATTPIPFNVENLHAICSQYPAVADQLFLLAHTVYEGTLKEEEAKN